MPLLSRQEVLAVKLASVPLEQLRELAGELGIDSRGSASGIVRRMVQGDVDDRRVDEYIRRMYRARIDRRRRLIPDRDLVEELNKVRDFSWGTVQGQLDQKIQSEYVRKTARYDDLMRMVRSDLYREIDHYVTCTWFNHWTTVLIEEHISSHRRVVPTLKHVKGVDIFFDGQPFDLKITYLPDSLSAADAAHDPKRVAVWMYEHQGAQRFGDDNRLFVVLADADRSDSWRLKREFGLIYRKIDGFFDEEAVSREDEVKFVFGGRPYEAVAKVLLITPG